MTIEPNSGFACNLKGAQPETPDNTSFENGPACYRIGNGPRTKNGWRNGRRPIFGGGGFPKWPQNGRAKGWTATICPAIFRPLRKPPPPQKNWPPAISRSNFFSGPDSHSVAGRPILDTSSYAFGCLVDCLSHVVVLVGIQSHGMLPASFGYQGA